MAKLVSVDGGDPEVPVNYPPPAKNRQRGVQQLVVQAEALLEQRLRDGTASPTETVALLRLGSENEQVTIDRIRAQTDYLIAQRAKAESETVREELFQEAMNAMQRYSPSED